MGGSDRLVRIPLFAWIIYIVVSIKLLRLKV